MNFVSSNKKWVAGSATHWVSALLVFVCSALGIAVALYEWEAYRAAMGQSEQTSRNLAASVLNEVQESLQQAETLVSLIVGTIESIPTWETSSTTAVLRDVILERIHAQPMLHEIYVYDAGGQLVVSSYTSARQENSALQQDFFDFHRRTARDVLHIGKPFRALPDGEWVVPASRRVNTPKGAFLGVVVAAVSVKHWQASFQQLDLGTNGLVAINSHDGIVLARYPHVESAIGASLKDTPVFRDFLSRSVRGSMRAASPIDKIERQNSFVHSTTFPVMAIVGTSTDQALSAWRSKAIFSFIIFGFLILLIAVAGAIIHRLLRKQSEILLQLSSAHRRSADMERALDEHALVSIVDSNGQILYANQKFCTLSKYTHEELNGRDFRITHSDVHPAVLFKEMRRTMQQGQVWKGELCERAKDGSLYWVESTVVPFLDKNGKPLQFIEIKTDITGRKRVEVAMQQAYKQLDQSNQRLAALAAFDQLTGLPNRRHFDEILDSEFKRAHRSGQPLAVLMVDVDYFKQFNDLYGHGGGDICLKRVAGALQRAERRPGDLAARWGGEEFAIILPNTNNLGAKAVAELVRCAVLSLYIEHQGSPLMQLSVSVGVNAIASTEVGDAEELINGADKALYQAKKGGRNRTHVHEASKSHISITHDAEARRKKLIEN
ncbi:diguanylate cyclase [Caldimonas tepidiphila]|uniref:diguanylate cyclase n=1 Tax=Caldimonas tepidiphila TaxID=2315841 RepID=UPI000E5C3A84|nr:diguanylate cyclase [Caldimonas tepidiphila]